MYWLVHGCLLHTLPFCWRVSTDYLAAKYIGITLKVELCLVIDSDYEVVNLKISLF